MSNNDLWVIDVEQFANFHSLCGINIRTRERAAFVLHESRDDRIKYLYWLNNCGGWITFNGINYDYPLVHNILENKSFFTGNSLDQVLSWLYRKNNEIIESKHSSIRENEAHIMQYDLFKINHYDRPQKSCSLKWLEFSLRWKNLQDLPFKPGSWIEDKDVDEIVRYNFNDVEATLMFWEYCQKQVELRKNISIEYGINARNMSDTSIGKNILAQYYSNISGVPIDQLGNLHDSRYLVRHKDIISDRITFKTKELKKLLVELKNDKTNLLSTEFKKRIKFNGSYYDMLKGGLHSHMPPGITREDKDYILLDFDWGSYYPNLMLELDVYPPQLGKEILIVLRKLTEMRLEAKAKGDKPTSDSLKLCINSCYGLMGSVYSFMYSPASMLTVTVNGQLFLMMLIEKLWLESGSECYYANTDGASFKVPKNRVADFKNACRDFYNVINIPQEFARYTNCYISNVNNYHITKDDGSVKRKGWFELPTDQLPHKNNSMGIVSIAIDRYIIEGIPFSETIKNHLKVKGGYRPYKDKKTGETKYEIKSSGIYDFLIGVKAKRAPKKGESHFELMCFQSGNMVSQKIQKVNRFFISNSGKKLIKCYEDGSRTKVIADKVYQTVLNNVTDPYDLSYDINYRWYEKQCEKIISEIDPTILKPNLSLF